MQFASLQSARRAAVEEKVKGMAGKKWTLRKV